ncbi:glycosyltransferase [Epilithonimonas arachidiradicis]|uniref:Glycosyltransferase EpsE n=1 Tax=Epilithonimonas arachidiradicis TaxID=1617282 RepID=A0A420CIL1_9FLAO|nr:glycosyltransferase [Epilithonimonas arachidiradicis]RKE78371.1 glycosyltransferase EpsE [Epilithonimonas arachidiradicis]GGG67202.1 putative glycosyltransferase EpsE [Epilithonimonas arachidiradicis]
MKARITILMSVYNCESTLEEALDSLYNQTYKNFKLVLCDDASSDRTYEIAKKYAKKYDNIILIKNEKNLSLPASLNKCLQYVDTEYVARMDGDDISLPKRFEKEINFLDNNLEYALVSCPMIYFDETGNWGKGNAIEKPTKNDFKIGTPFCHAPSMIRTSVMREVEGYTVNRYLIRGQDYYLWYKIYKKGYVGYNLQQTLYKMRDGKDAMKRRTFKTRYYGFLVKNQILKDLGIKYYFVYSFSDLLKGFIPNSLMKIIRRHRMMQ